MNTDTNTLGSDQSFQQRVLEESNHRVRNNLAMICALLEMEMSQAPENERGRLLISLARIRSLALPHEQADGSGKVDAGILIHAVIDDISSLYGQEKDEVSVICSSPLQLNIQCATYLSLVVSELASHIIDCSRKSATPRKITVGIENSETEIHITFESDCLAEGVGCRNINPKSWNILKGLIERSLGGRIELIEKRPFRVSFCCPLPHQPVLL